MKANPFDSPLPRSLMISTAVTFPACANRVFSSTAVVDLGRLPTYVLTSISATSFAGRAGKNEGRQPHNRAGGAGTAQNQLSSYKLLGTVYHVMQARAASTYRRY